MNMVVSHRETSISSNIRAIIEQLNLNPVERRRLIDRTCDNAKIRPMGSPKITIGVYGCRDNIDVKPKRLSDAYQIKKIEESPKVELNQILRDKNCDEMKHVDIFKQKIESTHRIEAGQILKEKKPEEMGKNEILKHTIEDSRRIESSQILSGQKSEEVQKTEFGKYRIENPPKIELNQILQEKNSDEVKKKISDLPKIGLSQILGGKNSGGMKKVESPEIAEASPVESDQLSKQKNSDELRTTDISKEEIDENSADKNSEISRVQISVDNSFPDFSTRRTSSFKDKNQNTTKIDIFNNETDELKEIKNWREKFQEKSRIEIIKGENGKKLRIEISKDDTPEKCKEHVEIVTPLSIPNGKVTIGVWGQSRTELRIERGGSFGKVIRKQEVHDESQCIVVSRSRKAEMRQRIPPEQKDIEVTRTQQDVVERTTPTPKEDLPELESASLNHTAAHHRIAIRPKNRRPPRRPTTNPCSTTIISTSSDTLDSLELMAPSASSSPVEPKAPSILRKSSSRLSRNCELFEELETKLPRKPASVASLSPDSLDSSSRTILDHPEPEAEISKMKNSNTPDPWSEDVKDPKPVVRRPSNRVSKGSDVFEELESRLPRRRSSNRLSKSPDSLENSISKSSDSFDKFLDSEEVKPSVRRLSSSISKSTEGFDKISESPEIRPLPRRPPSVISKSTEGFEKLVEHQENRFEPRPVARRLILPMAKSSDSLEVLEAVTSDDSIERRRSSFEIRPRRGMKVMSMSSENFDALAQVHERTDLQKRSSASDVNLSRGKRHCKVISKSSDSFEAMEVSLGKGDGNGPSVELGKPWRTKRTSESSDNFEEERIERKVRRPRRVASSTIIDIFPREREEEKSVARKPSRLQKSSESSDLGSTDTLDSERRHKSDSTETLDSLEKFGELESRDEEGNDNKRDGHDSWIKPESDLSRADDAANEEAKSPEKSYWRQTSESKENIDIHQLLALTIVNRISDNGNNQRNNLVQFPKKKLASAPTSPIKQEDNKLLFNNLLSSKNDEDLQNMLNGNISEVSTDTKSFKEKLIMFEKLGK